MSTDTRHPQYDDATLQAVMDDACQETHTKHPEVGGTILLASDFNTVAWPAEKPARLALARGLLARLPEPTPPTADGKTPGQVCWETWAVIPPVIEHGWSLIQNKEAWEDAASAVLAAFGGASLEAQAKLDYVHNMGLRFGMMTSSDKPEPYLAHTWVEDSVHERMFREWTESIGWQETVRKAEASLESVRARLIAAAREGFVPAAADWKARHDELQKAYAEHADVTAALHDKVQKAEAELADLRKDNANLRAACDIFQDGSMSTLRPIAEAGEVPDGAVRVFATWTGVRWIITTTQTVDTHFADILLPPEAKATAVEAAKPAATTFTAHGKTWNVHVPGDPMPVDPLADVCVIMRCEVTDGMLGESDQTATCWDWGTDERAPRYEVVGWRYADYPTPAEPSIREVLDAIPVYLPAPPPWQPAVGEPVRLVSGGWPMVVGKVEADIDRITTVWMDAQGQPQQASYPAACLVSAKEAQP